MKKYLVLCSLLVLGLQMQAQNFRDKILLHLKYQNGFLVDTVSDRQWGPYSNSIAVNDRFGQPNAFYFKGGNSDLNRVSLKNINIKQTTAKGLTLISWQGYDVQDSANFGVTFLDSVYYNPGSSGLCVFRGFYQVFNRFEHNPCLLGEELINRIYEKNRFKRNRWNFVFFSISHNMIRFGLNDTLYSYSQHYLDSTFSGCDYPLQWTKRLDSISEIRINYPQFRFAPCQVPLGYRSDKFRFYDDIMVFDTAYGPSDYEALRNFPGPPTQLTARKTILGSESELFFYYDPTEEALLFKTPNSGLPFRKIAVYDMRGSCIFAREKNIGSFSVRHLKPSLYIIKGELENGEVLVNRWLKLNP
jgi:hypothetical protein